MPHKSRYLWNRCDYCGKIIAYKEFEENTAERVLDTPDTAFTAETYETYHVKCRGDSVNYGN